MSEISKIDQILVVKKIDKTSTNLQISNNSASPAFRNDIGLVTESTTLPVRLRLVFGPRIGTIR